MYTNKVLFKPNSNRSLHKIDNARKGPYTDLGLRCPLTESIDTVVYVNEQRMPISDYMGANANLDLRYSFVAYVTFSHISHHNAI